jgi:hypothetical protein
MSGRCRATTPLMRSIFELVIARSARHFEREESTGTTIGASSQNVLSYLGMVLLVPSSEPQRGYVKKEANYNEISGFNRFLDNRN